MRRLAAAALLIFAALAAPASGQTAKLRPRQTLSPASAPASPVTPPARPALQLSPGPAALALPALPQPPVAPQRFTPLPLDPTAAAQCRSQCAEKRYFCLAGDGGPCDDAWSRCVLACRAPAS